MSFRALLPVCVLLCLALVVSAAVGDDVIQWGARPGRNMVSDCTGLPDRFDPETGENVAWRAAIGTRSWATPIAGSGCVFIGTNNGAPRDTKHDGDRGVMMCFDAADGSFRWQLVVPKLSQDRFLDWPTAGICSPVTIQGDRVYTVTNRDEVVCLDLNGMADGNDGPFQDEGRHMTPEGEAAMEPGPLDADILWLLDLRAEAGVRPHDSAHCSPLIDGPYLYINTNNGLNSTHTGVECPEGPSLVVVEKATGQLLARDDEGIGPTIFHSTWSSPALCETDGRRLVIFCGGNGVVYAFEPLAPKQLAELKAGPMATLTRVWRFDCDPTAPKENVHEYIRNREVSPSNIKSMPVVAGGRVYVTSGGDIWWGKRQARLQCIDPVGQGDITESGLVWSYPIETHCCSTPAVHDGLAYVGDCEGVVHCVDIETGKACWTHDTGRETWGSPLVADGKVYLGNRQGDFVIMAAGREKRVLSSVRLDTMTSCSATASDGTVHISTMTDLYALRAEE